MKMILAALAAFTLAGAAHPEQTASQALRSLGLGKQENMACGIPPIPPIGCKVGPCICDSYGQNCRWTFICS